MPARLTRSIRLITAVSTGLAVVGAGQLIAAPARASGAGGVSGFTVVDTVDTNVGATGHPWAGWKGLDWRNGRLYAVDIPDADSADHSTPVINTYPTGSTSGSTRRQFSSGSAVKAAASMSFRGRSGSKPATYLKRPS